MDPEENLYEEVVDGVWSLDVSGVTEAISLL